jgi:hypothetical protein
MKFFPRCLLPALGLACALPAASAAEPLSLSWRAAAFTSLVVRGMQISKPGSPVFMVSADAYAPSGWSLGGAITHLQSPTGEHGTGISLRAGQEWSLDDTWSVNLSARHDRYLDSPYLQLWCYNQLALTVAHEDQWSLTANWRPRRGPGCNNLPTAPNRALDIGARWPLSGQAGLDGSIGRLAGGPEAYTYGQLGVYSGWGPATVYLARTSTWGVTPSQPGTPRTEGKRWVASLVWKF